MKIYYLATSNIPSRTANSIHVMKMCQAYANVGHQVTLLVPAWPNAAEPRVRDIHAFYGVKQNFAIRRIPMLPWKRLDVIYFGYLLPLLAKTAGADLIHSRSLTAAWGATQFMRCRTIFETHDAFPTNNNRQMFLRQTLASRQLKSLVVITRALAEHVRPQLPATTHLVIAPDGVDQSWLEAPTSLSAVRETIGLAQETRRIAVYTGHLYPGRGIELILELAKVFPDHLFLLVGGNENDVAHYRAETQGWPNVQFTGFQTPGQIRLYQQAADVLLMPYGNRIKTSGVNSNTAPFASPIKMFEYMAAGRPILASTLPVLQEVLQDGVNALLLPYEALDRWCAALCRLQQEPSFAAALGKQARQDVQQYTWECRAQGLLA